uniref:Uncharacterized protein n=1 Tax=Kalanchoe fedtschenkoi TaxID=63787 RepID=A0A7N0U0D9_KALFE
MIEQSLRLLDHQLIQLQTFTTWKMLSLTKLMRFDMREKLNLWFIDPLKF